MKERLDQYTGETSLHFQAALNDAQICLEHAEEVISLEHTELMHVVATQRRAVREHDKI